MDPRWRPDSLQPQAQEAGAAPTEAPDAAGAAARPRRQRAGMKHIWDSQEEASWQGSKEGSASAGSSPRAAASSSPTGPRGAKRARRTLGQPQHPQRPPPRQQDAASTGSAGADSASRAHLASPAVGFHSTGMARGAAAPASLPGSPRPAGQPTYVAAGPLAAGPLDGAPAVPQRIVPSAPAVQPAAPQTPPVPAAVAEAGAPMWPPDPLPALPLLPPCPWHGAPAAGAAFPAGSATPASMQATPGVHMLHVVLPLASRQQWPLQLLQTGAPWCLDPPAGAAWHPASPTARTSAAPQLLPPPPLPSSPLQQQEQQQQQRQRQSVAAAASRLLWAELAQLASPAAAPDTCSLRRYEEEQRRYEERWRQYQRQAQEETREEAGLQGPVAQHSAAEPDVDGAQQAEPALPAQQAKQDQQAPAPALNARSENSSPPAVSCGRAQQWCSPFSAAAASGAGPAGQQGDAGAAQPCMQQPAWPQAEVTPPEAPPPLEQQQLSRQDPRAGLASASSFGAELGALFSAWQDGQVSLSLLPK